MNYSRPQIILAASLSGLSEIASNWLCTFLDEAVKQLGTIQAETLTDFFGQFCILNDVTEEEMRRHKKPDRIVKLRAKYTILAKQYFPNEPNWRISKEIDRHASTVFWILKKDRLRLIKQANLENMKTVKVPFDQWPVKYELTNLLKAK